jgi:hypothetical protein
VAGENLEVGVGVQELGACRDCRNGDEAVRQRSNRLACSAAGAIEARCGLEVRNAGQRQDGERERSCAQAILLGLIPRAGEKLNCDDLGEMQGLALEHKLS